MNTPTPRKRRTLTFAVLSALTLVTVSSSLASYTLLGSVRSYETEPFAAQSQAKKRALNNRSAILQQRLGFERALDDCVTKRMTDRTVECPDINDIDSYREFIRTDEDISQSVHKAAPSLQSKLANLTARERALVQQYSQRGSCPTALAGKGLYTLCVEMLKDSGSDTSNIRGFLNDRATSGLERSASQKNTLRDRIRQAQESLSQLFQKGEGDQVHYQAQ